MIGCQWTCDFNKLDFSNGHFEPSNHEETNKHFKSLYKPDKFYQNLIYNFTREDEVSAEWT